MDPRTPDGTTADGAWTIYDGLQLGADAVQAAQSVVDGNPAGAFAPAINIVKRVGRTKAGQIALAVGGLWMLNRWANRKKKGA